MRRLIRRSSELAREQASRHFSGSGHFVFTASNFKNPDLPAGLRIVDVPLCSVESNADLEGFGKLVDDPRDFTAENKTFEIEKWPLSGWRSLDPETGDEAGTTEGDFQVSWKGDFFFGKNLAIASSANEYLEGIACSNIATAVREGEGFGLTDEVVPVHLRGSCIHLWMSDYHPDGGQLFFPKPEAGGGGGAVPFFVCLGKAAVGDDVTPADMRAFRIPAGRGVYIHPGTWHNGVQLHRKHGPRTFFTRQGRVHARVSASWAAEFQCLLRMPLTD